MDTSYYERLRNNSRDVYDRYKNCHLLKDKATGEVLLSTREIVEIPVHPRDTYHRVQSHEVSRLDMLAHQYYNNPLLWWILAQANNIYDPFELLEPGALIRIPNIETLYGHKGILL